MIQQTELHFLDTYSQTSYSDDIAVGPFIIKLFLFKLNLLIKIRLTLYFDIPVTSVEG
jgi:hypothetical protein